MQYINTTYRRTGTLWDSRYKSSLIQAETYLLACQRYIELNPVRAAMVDTLAGQREFNVGPHVVLIEISAQPNKYFTRVFLDGALYIEELFPQYNAPVVSDKPTSYLFPAFTSALVAALVALWQSGLFVN